MKRFYAKEIRKQISIILSSADGRSIKNALAVALGDIAAAIEAAELPEKSSVKTEILFSVLGAVLGAVIASVLCLRG